MKSSPNGDIGRARGEYEMVNEKMYLDRKGLVLNTEKMKMIKFRREEEEEER